MNDLRFACRQLLEFPGLAAMCRSCLLPASKRIVSGLFVSLWSLAMGAESHFVVRPLSLKDCIQIALEHNLDVKIERFTPEIARYDLNLAYARYEPVLAGSGLHRFDFEDARADSRDRVGT